MIHQQQATTLYEITPEELEDVSVGERAAPRSGAAMGVAPITERIDHPAHYGSHPSGVECITIVEAMGFCIGNAIKYLFRRAHKGNALEDVKKARWYVERELAFRKSERWAAYPRDPRLEVSTMGRVRRATSLRLLKRAQRSEEHDVTFGTIRDGIARNHSVPRAVIETFLGPIAKGTTIKHVDGDATNNRISNLAIEPRHWSADPKHLAALEEWCFREPLGDVRDAVYQLGRASRESGTDSLTSALAYINREVKRLENGVPQ